MNVLKSSVFLALLFWLFCLSCSQAETLGRLFFTPQDRVYLEQLRWAPVESLSSVSEQHQENVAAPADTKPAFLTFGGTVTRSNGEQVFWLNGVSCNRANLPVNVRVPQAFVTGRIELQVEEKGKLYSLRPGQTLDANSGQVRESYERAVEVAAPATATGQEFGSNQHPAVEGAPVAPVPVQCPASSSPIK